MRLQQYGVGIFTAAFTKSALKKVLKKNGVRVNGIIATSATFIHGGECISLTIPVTVPPNKKLVFPLKVIFEDEHLAVIHKPAGILVSGNRFKTIANALAQNVLPSTLPDATKPQPVHRLDYATTGILLVGKTSSSIRALNKLFDDKKVEKIYYAITIGKMNDGDAITLAIDGKTSQTYYTVLATVASKRFHKLNLVKLNPLTGRRHQLRKHLSSMGNPILGDATYGIESLILKGKGMYLHAYALSIIHPFTNEYLQFKDDFPERFQRIFKADIEGILTGIKMS